MVELRDPYLVERTRITTELISTNLNTGECGIRVLDLGCGDGRASNEIIKSLSQGFRLDKYIGVDIKMKIQTENSIITKIECDLNQGIRLDDDDQYDLIIGLEVVEHLLNPDILIKECKRLLKKGGILCISTVNLLAWYNRFIFLFGSLPIHYEVSTKKKYGRMLARDGECVGHIHVFSPRALSELLEDYGFEVCCVKVLQFVYDKPIISRLDSLMKLFPSFSSAFVTIARKV